MRIFLYILRPNEAEGIITLFLICCRKQDRSIVPSASSIYACLSIMGPCLFASKVQVAIYVFAFGTISALKEKGANLVNLGLDIQIYPIYVSPSFYRSMIFSTTNQTLQRLGSRGGSVFRSFIVPMNIFLRFHV